MEVTNLLSSNSYDLKNYGIAVYEVLRAINQIIMSTNSHIQFMIDLGVIAALKYMLGKESRMIVKEACVVVGNILISTTEQVEEVAAANLFPELLKVVENRTLNLRTEASMPFANAAINGSLPVVAHLVRINVIWIITDLLILPQNRVVVRALTALEEILKKGQHLPNNPYAEILKSYHAFGEIQALTTRPNTIISGTANRIMRDFFPPEPEPESESVPEPELEPPQPEPQPELPQPEPL